MNEDRPVSSATEM